MVVYMGVLCEDGKRGVVGGRDVLIKKGVRGLKEF
jgi:hypothetical protein